MIFGYVLLAVIVILVLWIVTRPEKFRGRSGCIAPTAGGIHPSSSRGHKVKWGD